jgi:hypothetical protein
MRIHDDIERCRVLRGLQGTNPRDPFGCFFISGPCGQMLKIIASSGDPSINIHWEHVSVSLENRTPNWKEMCFVKEMFWDDEDTVIQFHPPKSRYVNTHPYCLHLWRPIKETIPLPPLEAV